MGLIIGIVGLPNVGKSTLFNALTHTQSAAAANYPFCTIEPNKATVLVPDDRLEQLARLEKPRKIVPATVDFVDIAGLVRGASRGEGLGNKFLSHIREVDAILHVVRCFETDDVAHVEGRVDPLRDIEIVETELLLADIEALEKRVNRLTKLARTDKNVRQELEAAIKLKEHVEAGNTLESYKDIESEELKPTLRETQFLTSKKTLFVANVSEEHIAEDNPAVTELRDFAARRGARVIRICGKMEEELSSLDDLERAGFLASYGVEESSLNAVARESYSVLGLISFLTVGPREAHAWTVRRGTRALAGAGAIHSDFERGFIRAQVIAFEDYIRLGGEAACKAAGLARMEGKDYVLKDGDIVLFLFSV